MKIRSLPLVLVIGSLFATAGCSSEATGSSSYSLTGDWTASNGSNTMPLKLTESSRGQVSGEMSTIYLSTVLVTGSRNGREVTLAFESQRYECKSVFSGTFQSSDLVTGSVAGTCDIYRNLELRRTQ